MLTEYDKIIALILALSASPTENTAFKDLAAGGHDPAFPVKIQACPRPLGRYEIEGKTIICGTVSVPENHDAPKKRRLEIVFTVLKSHSKFPEADPVVHLHGGPGGGLLGGLKTFAELFDDWRRTRDIVMFDQRAAGLSARSTDCYNVMTANIVDIIKGKAGLEGAGKDNSKPRKLFGDCVTELQNAGIDLKYYNTDQNARDVIAIVKTLGYKSYNLYGISYGTKLSLEVMRKAPVGLRSVIIDGVAPPSVRLYDTLAVPQNEAILALVRECAEDALCNEAYPELGNKIHEAFKLAMAKKIMFQGKPLPPSIVSLLFSKRNGAYRSGSYTMFLPAAIYEITRGGEMPTLKTLLQKQLNMSHPGPMEVIKAGKKLTDEQKRLLKLVATNSGIFRDGSSAMDLAIDELKGSLRKTRELGPLPSLFDQEMAKAIRPILTDKKRVVEALQDYAALQNAKPAKELLRQYVKTYLTDESQQRLLALINAMSDVEIKNVFETIHADIGHHESKFTGNAHLFIYACQEDMPYNSMAGYQELTKSLDYPQLGPTDWDEAATAFYDLCKLFKPQPRPGFHEPIVSDIPTLSLGSTWDTQTAASWANDAVKTLKNGQAFIIPEAGHGAIAYQQCAIDMGVAFINNPKRKLSNHCAETLRPKFYIAPWVEKEAKKKSAEKQKEPN